MSKRSTESRASRRSYLIQDPYDDDAIRFIETIFRAFGLRPICFYTDPKRRFYGERMYPFLKSRSIEASVDVDLDDLGSFAEQISEEYDIGAVIPYREDTIEVAAELLGHLRLDWNDAETMARFRDKDALKRYVSSVDGGVRVPASRIVRSYAEVTQQELPSRFVLKPNNGMGSEQLGFFSPGDEDAIAAHLDAGGGRAFVLEEFIDGPEFRINGLVRRDGTVQTLGIWEYMSKQLDEHFTLAYAFDSQLRSSDARFDELHAYAVRVLAATGARGFPFHLEVRVDERGPAVIDLGARVGSEATGLVMSYLHPTRPDVYSVAARDYFGPNDFAMEPVDYTFYDAGTSMYLSGISYDDGLVSAVHGLSEVEAMPEFVFWSVIPRVGDAVRPTRDLRGCPYIVNLRHEGDLARSHELAERVWSTVGWSVDDGLRSTVVGRARNVGPRAVAKSRWVLHRWRTAAKWPA